MIVPRLIACTLIAAGLASAASAAWLIWQGPHCRLVPAHAYYMTRERC